MKVSTLFGDLLLSPIKVLYSVFRPDKDTTLVSSGWSSNASPNASLARLEQLVGGDLLTDFAYALGALHPRLNEQPGQSMRDAFSAFEAMLRKRSPKVRIEDRLFEGNLDQNIVTFGSPSSNALARRSLGYEPAVSTDDFILREAHNFGIKPAIRYRLASADQKVNRLRYYEPHWTLLTPKEELEPRLTATGCLKEDFLVVTCTPNLLSAPTVSRLCARIERRMLLDDPPDSHADAAKYQRYRYSLDDAERASNGPIHKQLIIGGLHGPGTAAGAFLMRPELIDRLAREVKLQRLDGSFWQAVVRVSVDVDGDRDRPKVAHPEELEVYPIEVP